MIPHIFTNGIRELLIIDRNDKNKCHMRTLLTTSHQYTTEIPKFIEWCNSQSNESMRVYLSINERDLTKAIYELKHQMLQWDYAGSEIQFLSLDKTFRHILMQPHQRKTKYFLVDIDTTDKNVITDINRFLIDHKIEQVHSYKTPNGFHFITKPFNPNLAKWKGVEIKPDALMLLHANDSDYVVFDEKDYV